MMDQYLTSILSAEVTSFFLVSSYCGSKEKVQLCELLGLFGSFFYYFYFRLYQISYL